MTNNDSHIFQKFDSQAQFEKYINRPQKEWDEEKGQFDFEQCHFNFDINFAFFVKEFNSLACFKNATFIQNVSFKGLTFKNIADFNGCIFKKNASFSETIFDNEANFCSFNGDVTFYKAKFNSFTFFWNYFAGYTNFSYSRFKESTDFSECIFEKDVKFHNATFEKDAFFNESEFKGKVNAWKMTFNKDVTFKWTDFRKKANLSEMSVEKGYLELFGVNFESNAYFYDSKIKRLDLKKSVIDKSLFFLGAEIKRTKRETARIIKNEFLKQNNRIEALKYHQKEMKAYIIELGQNIIMPKSFYSFFKSIGDIVILLINLISNGFGLWWFLSIIFLFGSTLIVYDWYLTSLDSASTIDFWIYYPEFILPTHKFGFIEGTTPNNYTNLIDFFGRVVSSFGIYQTVQAFRKFGRF